MINWGIIGGARIAEKAIIPAILQIKGHDVVAIGSRTAERAARLSALASHAQPYDSYDAVLNDHRVNAVYIGLPNSLHAEWTIKALEKGKHVLCEKPFAASYAEALAMVEAAKKSGKTLMEAFMYRYHPLTRRVLELVKSGKIGEIRAIHSAFAYMLANKMDIRRDAALAGGALFDVGTYCVSVVRLLAGAEPIRLSASAVFGETGVDESVSGEMWFPDKLVATFFASFETARYDSLTVTGTKGVILVPSMFNYAMDSMLRLRLSDQQVHASPTEFVEHIHYDNPYKLMVENFGKVILENHQPLITLGDSLAQQYALDALLESARKNAM